MTGPAAGSSDDVRGGRAVARAAAGLVAGLAIWRLWQIAESFLSVYRYRRATFPSFSAADILATGDLAASAAWLLALAAASVVFVATVRRARLLGLGLVAAAVVVTVAAAIHIAPDLERIFRWGRWDAARPRLLDATAAVACLVALAWRSLSTPRRRVAAAGLVGATLVAGVSVELLVRRQRWIGMNESTAIGFLRSLTTAQAVFRQARVVDQDRDGEGEYGWLAEILGHATPRVGPPQPPEWPYEPWQPGQLAHITWSGQVWIKSGYCFVLYLPTAGGRAQAEPVSGEVAVAAADAPLQRQRWACYAWPYEAGRTGVRMFVADSNGDVYCTAQQARRFSGADDVPPPEAAYNTAGPAPRNLDAGIGLFAAGLTAGDGNSWTPAGG